MLFACLIPPLLAIPALIVGSGVVTWLILLPQVAGPQEMSQALPKGYPIILTVASLIMLATC